MAVDTIKELIDVTYNPRRWQERTRLFETIDMSGIFGKAPTSDALTTDANIRQVMYGAPAMQWLNYNSEVWSLLPKKPVPPGSRLGYRVLQGGEYVGAASGVQETGYLRNTQKATFVQIYFTMKWMDTMFGASERVMWQAERDDALDIFQEYRDHFTKRHTNSIDFFLTRPVSHISGMPAAQQGPTSVVQATFVIDTIDRMISSSAEATYLISSGGLTGATAANVYPYAGNYRRAGFAGTGFGDGPYDAIVDQGQVVYSTTSGRSFDLTLLDGVIRQVKINGATQDLSRLIMLTGEDTADVINQRLEARQRFLTTSKMVKTLNGVERASPVGVDAGLEVLSYKGIPIFTSKNLFNTRRSGFLTNLYGIYLDDVYIALGMPTLYLETDRSHWLLLDYLRRKAGFFTAAELVFTRFNRCFKITNVTV